MDDSNIIKFPKEKLLTPDNIQTQEDMLKQIEEYKLSFADDIAEILSNHIFGELARSGVNFEGNIDELFPSMVLVTQAIQSLHLKASGVYHPLQDFADDVFDDDSADEEEVDKSDEKEYNETSESTENKDND